MLNKMQEYYEFKRFLQEFKSSGDIDLTDFSKKLYVKEDEFSKTKRVRILRLTKFGFIKGERYAGKEARPFNQSFYRYPLSSLEDIKTFLTENQEYF